MKNKISYGEPIASVFAHDHPGLNVLLRPDKKPPAFLNVIERISGAHACFHRYHHATITPFDLALEPLDLRSFTVSRHNAELCFLDLKVA